MKKLIIALIATLGIFTADTVQAGDRYLTFTHAGVNHGDVELKTIYTLKAGEVAEMTSFFGTSATKNLYFEIGGVTYPARKNPNFNEPWATLDKPIIAVGPAILKLYNNNGNDNAILTLKISPTLAE